MRSEFNLWQKKLKDGLDIAHNFHFDYAKRLPKNINKIIFFGIGGSGVVGRVVKTFFDKKSKIPTFVVNSSHVPPFVDSGTFAIVVSYSGNTWETVNALRVLADKFIPTLVLTRGGVAAEIAESKNIPLILLPESKTPRSALGNFLGIILGIFDLMGLIDGKKILSSFEKQANLYVPKFEDRSYFGDFLSHVKDSDVLCVWGVEGDSGAFAYRAQTQFNENSKVKAVFSSFPELCHNLLVGFSKNAEKPPVVLFFSDFLPSSLEIALEAMMQLLKKKGVSLYKPRVLGDNWEEQLFHMILWSDFASYYLAEDRGVDATPVKIIEELKQIQKAKGVK